MRVITGTARGRKLAAPPGLETRPTTEVVKEAVFSAVQFEIEGSNVLDLFAGSGQMGIEALSRGAKSAVFVDNARASQAVLRQNLEHTGLGHSARVVAMDVFAYLRTAVGPFDMAFLDPPYGKGMAQKALLELAPIMRESGIIFCETSREEALPDRLPLPDEKGFAVYRQYRHGKVLVTQYRRETAGEEPGR